MIPAEAVEAAAKAMALKSYNKEFDAMDDHTQNFLRDNARLALEAAAPHMSPSGVVVQTRPAMCRYCGKKHHSSYCEDAR